MDNDLQRTAYHEAAHAVADTRFGFSAGLVSIERQDGSLGRSAQIDGYYDQKTAERYVFSALAGYVAEEKLDPTFEVKVHAGISDFDLAYIALEQLEKNVDDDCWDRWLNKTRAWVNDESNWRAIEEVAAELLEHRMLNWDEVEAIVSLADGDDEALQRIVLYRMYGCSPPRIVRPAEPTGTFEGRNFLLEFEADGSFTLKRK